MGLSSNIFHYKPWTSVRDPIYCLGRMNFEYLFYKAKLCFLHRSGLICVVTMMLPRLSSKSLCVLRSSGKHYDFLCSLCPNLFIIIFFHFFSIIWWTKIAQKEIAQTVCNLTAWFVALGRFRWRGKAIWSTMVTRWLSCRRVRRPPFPEETPASPAPV